MKLCYSGATDVGHKRQINQDSYGVGDPFNHTRQINQDIAEMDSDASKQMGLLLVVCDGMGGHTAGEVASRLGVESILEEYYHSSQGNHMELLKRAFFQANQRIYAQGEGSMGTTGVAALFHHRVLYIANVGDSRAYLIRNKEIRQVTKDHSLVAEQLDAGLITSEQARTANYRNMITRALGYRPDVEVDVFTEHPQPGDLVVLSSDGMHGLIDDQEIVEIVNHLPLDEAVTKLITVSNQRGGPDNITVVVGKFDESDTPCESLVRQRPTIPHTLSERETRPLTNRPEAETFSRQVAARWPFWTALAVILVFLTYGGFVVLQPEPPEQESIAGGATNQTIAATTSNHLAGGVLPVTATATLTLTSTLAFTSTPTMTATISPTSTPPITVTLITPAGNPRPSTRTPTAP